jgi:hypothetical protein
VVIRAIGPTIFFPEEEDREIGLSDVKRINYTFWKPITIPIDLTVDVPAK